MATKDEKLRARALRESANAPKKKTKRKATKKAPAKKTARGKRGTGGMNLGELERAAGVVERARKIIAKADGRPSIRRR